MPLSCLWTLLMMREVAVGMEMVLLDSTGKGCPFLTHMIDSTGWPYTVQLKEAEFPTSTVWCAGATKADSGAVKEHKGLQRYSTETG